ncbi:FAD-dependent oxidoreductase [Sphingobacterium sp. PU5-4]|uniref:FAD-dependent oxidoreductase n=1 Tax=Sphingobacterium tenebrionis TaxID=3111775 RepID=A0ABU8I206_9SPHI
MKLKQLQIILSFLVLLQYSCSKKPELLVVPPKVVDTLTVRKIDTTTRFDVVIYGATMAGIIAAKEVQSSGKTVVIINPMPKALGGMTTNGLGITDVINTNILGGLTRKFYQDIQKYYSNPATWVFSKISDYARYNYNGDVMIWFEPKAAQYVINKYIVENKIQILYDERLNLSKKIVKDVSGRINYLEMESGLRIKGHYFIDATYEGDVMAKAGVSYIIGRESNSVYGETANGIQRMWAKDRNELPDGITGLPGEVYAPIGSHGSGDKKIQAYCFRMCLTNLPENRIPFPKPINYNENDYAILFEYVKSYEGFLFCDFMPLPNRKTDSNNLGPFSTDFVGANYDYPDGNYEKRREIIEKHKTYQMGLMWTLANHPKIPERIRNYYKEWGLPKDEFTDNNNWPNQLYIREGRRMISDYVMTEKNCSGKLLSTEGIALGDYPMDSHIVSRYKDANGFIKNEGQVMAGVPKPYPIDYKAIVPKKIECSNLFVPICLSASHIAYGSIRMEPVFMSLAQASAVSAVLALESKIAVQDVKYENLMPELVKRGLVIK